MQPWPMFALLLLLLLWICCAGDKFHTTQGTNKKCKSRDFWYYTCSVHPSDSPLVLLSIVFVILCTQTIGSYQHKIKQVSWLLAVFPAYCIVSTTCASNRLRHITFNCSPNRSQTDSCADSESSHTYSHKHLWEETSLRTCNAAGMSFVALPCKCSPFTATRHPYM